MKLTRLAIGLGIAALSASSAFAAETVHNNVSRKTGGEVLEHRTDPGVNDIGVLIGSQNFKILLHSLSYVTSDGKSHVVSLQSVASTNPQMSPDANGYFIVPKLAPVSFRLAEKSLNITAIRVQAESFGGSGNLLIGSQSSTSNKPAPGPQPVPQPRPQPVPQPSGDAAAERQCSLSLPVVTSNLRTCNSNQIAEQNRAASYDNDLRTARQRLANIQIPLDQCNNDLNDSRNRGNQIASDLQNTRNERQSLQNNLQAIRLMSQEASNARSGRGYRCSVNGRHQRFVGDGSSAAKALQSALAQCGENNCGKGDFSGSWSCVTL
jgi:hypothetical protein